MARYHKMSVDQTWNNVWPTASMFKQSAIPFAVRQGFVKNSSENDGLPPEKYGNTELMKIPNFLHLTPPQIKIHCEAIKSLSIIFIFILLRFESNRISLYWFYFIEFCTKWPKELQTDEDCEKNFPIEITTGNYIYDGPNIRDDRARTVTLNVITLFCNFDFDFVFFIYFFLNRSSCQHLI